MSRRKYPKGSAPRWQEFLNESFKRIVATNGLGELTAGAAAGVTVVEQIAREIAAHGDGPAFLKAVRRGRPTERQNLRYQMLREIERALGDSVPRRRPANNIPDSLALKKAPADSPDADQREFGI